MTQDEDADVLEIHFGPPEAPPLTGGAPPPVVEGERVAGGEEEGPAELIALREIPRTPPDPRRTRQCGF